MPDSFEPTVDLSTPPTAVRWDLGERAPVRRSTEKICGLRLGRRLFALDARFVRGLRHIERLTPMPLTPAHLIGVTHLEGSILPVLDLGPILGVPEPRGGAPWCCLWVSSGAFSVLLAVDEVVAFESATTEPTPVEDGDPADGLADTETTLLGQPAPVLDLPRLLDRAHPGRGTPEG